MADRPEVRTAPAPITVIDLVGLAGAMGAACLRVPFRQPRRGPGDTLRNVTISATRELCRSFLGYSMSLPVDEFRGIERVLDRICGVVLPPRAELEHVHLSSTSVGGVPGIWFRPRDARPRLRMLYLHGGGYIGTSPRMYTLFAAHLARATRCDIFVADYRLAPEFPYPAGLDDALAVLAAIHADEPDATVLVAGDSGGGGLAASVLYECGQRGLPDPAGALLFSPEISLSLDLPSVTENAPYDVLPWNIPTTSYLHGVDPRDVAVSGSDVSHWPPTFVAYGGDEMFRDANRALVGRLRTAGVETHAHEQPGMFHVYPLLAPWAASSRATCVHAGTFVARLDGDTAAVGSGAAGDRGDQAATSRRANNAS